MRSAASPGASDRRHRVLLFVAAGAVVLAGCSTSPRSSNDSTVPGAATTSIGAVVTPNGLPGKTEAPTVAPTQTGVRATIIETPSEVLVSGSGKPKLATDFTPSDPNVATVLQAIVPEVSVYESATDTQPSVSLKNPLPSGAPLTFLVDGQTSTRYKVLLPIRPNGRTGWIDPNQVKKFAHRYKIVVELGAHRLTAYQGDTVILTDKIATGKDQTPTPNGRYFIKELLKPCYDKKQPDGSSKCVQNDAGAYGPYAYGLSGFSPVVQHFDNGDDVIGIHGTNEPQSLGRDFSHGCIRMSNESISTLAKILPLGTPVIVRA